MVGEASKGFSAAMTGGVSWSGIDLSDTEGSLSRRIEDVLVVPAGEGSPPLIMADAIDDTAAFATCDQT